MKYVDRWNNELIESLTETAEKFANMGFEVKVFNCGHMFEAYKAENVEEYEQYGFTFINGTTISCEEVYRHNATEENVNVSLKVYAWKDRNGKLCGKEEKKLKFRMDASENVKNKRISEAIDRYNRYK